MGEIIILFICIVVFDGIATISNLIKGDKDVLYPDLIISTGLSLITSVILSLADNIIIAVLSLEGISVASDNPYPFLVCGLALVVIGLLCKKNMREKVHVLNMHGLISRDISDKKAIKELKLADYKVKEQVIDFIPFFNNGNINAGINRSICNQIQTNVESFIAKTSDDIGCFTGMAPIPYTIYAGTFMEKGNVDRYFEYDGRDNEKKYYELKKATRKQKRAGWSRLIEEFPININADSEEVVLAISISHTIADEQLVQFKGKDVIKLKLEETGDNIIQSIEQLQEYSKGIYECINVDIDKKYPSLKTIHLVASVPSCVSVNIGKNIGLRTNRNVDIIAYHFIRTANPTYKFGVFVNGSNKGQYIEE